MISASEPGLGWCWAEAMLLSCALLLAPRAARAEEDAETRTAARDLATQGAQAFDAGNYADASDFFRRAHELVRAPSIALLEARSLAKLSRLLEAIDIYEQTAHFKLSPESPAAYAAAVQAARAEVEEVRKRLPRLKLTLLRVPEGEVAQVTMDEKPTPAAMLGVERPVNPGQHRIQVRLSGKLRASRELSLLEGESYQIALELQPEPSLASVPSQDPRLATVSPAAASKGEEARSDPRMWGYIGLGVGALGLGVGTYTGLVALHHKSNLDAACHEGCPPSSADEISSFRTNRTVSWLSYGIGAAAAATGVVLLTLGKPAHERVTLRALPNGLQIAGKL